MSIKNTEEFYVGDRVYYQSPPTDTNSHVMLEEKERGFGGWTIVLGVIFTIILIVIVVCLVVFFTVGRNNIDQVFSQQQPSLLSSTLRAEARRLEGHNDFASVNLVHSSLQRGSPRICLFDTAYFSENNHQHFRQAHIPTSRHFDIDKATDRSDTKRRVLKHPLGFQNYIRSLGIDEDCQVVLYDQGEIETALKSATYGWWLFKLYGYGNVSIMNGGIKKWRALNFKTTKAILTERQGNFQAKWDSRWLITFQDIKKLLQKKQPHVVFVDTRKPSEFNGQEKHQLAKSFGRIKGAINIPMESLLNNDGSLKQILEIAQIFKSAGLEEKNSIVVYCNTGLLSSTVYFAMVQTNLDAKMYDGGWIEFENLAPDEFKVVT